MLYRIIFPGSIFLLLFYNFISDPELCMKIQGIVGKTGESPALSRNCKNEWSGCSLFTGEPDYKDFKPGRWRITMHIRPAMYRTGIGMGFIFMEMVLFLYLFWIPGFFICLPWKCVLNKYFFKKGRKMKNSLFIHKIYHFLLSP